MCCRCKASIGNRTTHLKKLPPPPSKGTHPKTCTMIAEKECAGRSSVKLLGGIITGL